MRDCFGGNEFFPYDSGKAAEDIERARQEMKASSRAKRWLEVVDQNIARALAKAEEGSDV